MPPAELARRSREWFPTVHPLEASHAHLSRRPGNGRDPPSRTTSATSPSTKSATNHPTLEKLMSAQEAEPCVNQKVQVRRLRLELRLVQGRSCADSSTSAIQSTGRATYECTRAPTWPAPAPSGSAVRGRRLSVDPRSGLQRRKLVPTANEKAVVTQHDQRADGNPSTSASRGEAEHGDPPPRRQLGHRRTGALDALIDRTPTAASAAGREHQTCSARLLLRTRSHQGPLAQLTSPVRPCANPADDDSHARAINGGAPDCIVAGSTAVDMVQTCATLTGRTSRAARPSG